MTFPIVVKMHDDQFSASLVGAPDVRVVELTRDQAIAALKANLQQRVEHGELLSLDIDAVSISSLAGKYSTDPTLREICNQAYQRRDAERPS